MNKKEAFTQDITAAVTKIQKFCTHDGPGIRTTVFFKGCPLRCRWCHNPETQSTSQQFYYSSELCIGCGACAAVCENACHRMSDGIHTVDRTACLKCMRCAEVCPTGALELCGRRMSIGEIMHRVLQDVCFYGKEGGLTLSGGEPMAQPEAAVALLKAAKAAGLHTAIETCGHFDASYVPQLAAITDIFLFDLKDSDSDRHREYTGVLPDRILANLHILDECGAKIRLRCIMVANVNMCDEHLRGISDRYHALSNCEGVELLPYHQFGAGKSVLLGGESGANSAWVPTPKEMSAARRFLRKNGVRVI